MSQTITAIFQDGVLRPDKPLQLPASTRVRLTVDVIEAEPAAADEAWAELEDLWTRTTIDSGGACLTRDQLHERR